MKTDLFPEYQLQMDKDRLVGTGTYWKVKGI